uniref:THO complex subunit 3 n=1 Tax=Tetraselmis sp. GSL018 TaxID=582737 RepID=A0A061S7R3_9CHLO
MKLGGVDPFSSYKLRELHGHREKVYCVAWSCEGNKLASGSSDKTIRIWNTDSSSQGKFAKTEVELKGHSESVDTLSWDPTHPDRLVTASSDKTVRLWDTRSNKCAECITGSSQQINVVWSPDGRTIAAGSRDDDISFVDVRKFKITKTHKYPYQVNEIAWSRCGTCFFITSNSGSIEMMSYPSMELVRSLKAHSSCCYSIAFDPAGKYLASGGGDALVGLWDLEELICTHTFIRMDTPVRAIDFSHDSKHLAFASEDVFIDIVDVNTGELVHQITCNSSSDSIAWNPKHKMLAFAGDERDGRQGSLPFSVGIFAP